MSENIEIRGRRVSVSVERKIGDSNYGSTTFRAWAEDDVPDGADHNAVSQLIVDLGNAVKAAVYDHCGSTVEVDETGVLRETGVTPAVGMSADQAATSLGGTRLSKIRIMNQDKFPDAVVPGDIEALCVKHGIDAVWANKSQYGFFFKERVKQGESPIFADHEGRAKILKGNLVPQRDDL